MASDTTALIEGLEGVGRAVAAMPSTPTIAGSEAADAVRTGLIAQIHDYLLPRLRALDAPLLIGIGGSTGSGKSILVNTIVGAEVSPTSVIRPTTRVPVLLCAPTGEAWFLSGGLLADLPRLSDSSDEGLRVVPHDAVSPGVALLDTPDIDSIEVENHALAQRLLGACDLWLFVTTAARYADALPWELLDTAYSRGTSLAVVVNRIPPDAGTEVVADMRRLLDEHHLEEATIDEMPESELVDRMLPEMAIAPVRATIDALAADAERRSMLIRTTLDGAVSSIPDRVATIRAHAQKQVAAVDALTTIVTDRHDEALTRIGRVLDGGSLLRGEVLAGWQEYVGTGTVMRRLQSGLARLGDRFRGLFTSIPTADDVVTGELRTRLVVAVTEAADRAADETVAGWEASPGGLEALGSEARRLSRPSPGQRDHTDREVRDWQDVVMEMVRTEASGRHLAARTASLGINTVGASLMIIVFAHTGGLTGGEVAIAGGTAALSQTVLTAMFGEQAVRDLARRSHDDLMQRLTEIIGSEARRFHERLEGMQSSTDIAGLDEALATLGAAQ